jgi:HK97 family phage major capsid protein
MALSAFESYIVEVIAESIARKIENYIFTGTGSDQPGGVKVAGKVQAAHTRTAQIR